MFFEKISYAIQSLVKSLDGKHNICPSCGSSNFFFFGGKSFSKFPTSLRNCQNCFLLYRFPITLQSESLRFYELEYSQPGLTTDLPDKETLSNLLANNFLNSEKDFSIWIPLLKRLSVVIGRKIRVIDYGANWGYTVYQLSKLDFISECVGYEYSKVRSNFGKNKLGINYIDEHDFNGTFDVVFSSHVIEHMYNPSIFREHMDSLLTNSGFVVLTCPNGSLSGVVNHSNSWRKLWGKVHPNMISDLFLLKLFDGYNGSIQDDNLSDLSVNSLLDSCQTAISSYMPTSGNLLALIKKRQVF
jgi:hypothetical protein